MSSLDELMPRYVVVEKRRGDSLCVGTLARGAVELAVAVIRNNGGR